MRWSDYDSDNLARVANALDPPPPPDNSPAPTRAGPVGAIFTALIVTFVITVPIGIVMAIAEIPTVYENLVFWPIFFIACFVFWPKK